jgi:hypothetical protein
MAEDGARKGIDERTARLIRTITGLDPELVDDYDIRDIDPMDRAQVRVDRNLAPKERVQSYIWMKDAGDEFPAIVMTRDGVIGDGNTRIRADKERGDFLVRAWVIPVDYKEADPETQARISYVGECLNAKNGQPPTKEEQANQVRHGIRIGLGDKQISTEAGVNPTFVKSLRARVAAETRLDALGVEYMRTDGEKPLIAEAALAALGKADDLDDEAFTAVAELARDAGFTRPEAQGAISTAREQVSPAARLDVVRREREANKERIADREHGRNGHPPLSRQLKRNLGFITKNTASALVEHNRDMAEDHLEAVEQALVILGEVVELQRQVNAQMFAGAGELPVDAA